LLCLKIYFLIWVSASLRTKRECASLRHLHLNRICSELVRVHFLSTSTHKFNSVYSCTFVFCLHVWYFVSIF
jgi:hypothetical protein